MNNSKRKIGFGSGRGKVIFSIFLIAIVSIFIFLIAGYYSSRKQTSYLPGNLSSIIDSLPSTQDQITLKNSGYHLVVDHSGRISISTPDHHVILSSLTYFVQFNPEKEAWGLKNVSVLQTNDSTIEIKGSNSESIQVRLDIITHMDQPKIDIQIKNSFLQQNLIQRIALIASFDIPVTEVFLKNRQVDYKDFDQEYWLQNEGVHFGSGNSSALIYHTPGISSLQLETPQKLLFINLDYNLDHPFVHLPFQEDEGRRWVDFSASDFKAGYTGTDSFSINIGIPQKSIPRLMLVPDGFKAGYVFTEHADAGQIRTQRAAYFGSEDITEANKATGGFVYYKIPVTKSVFYTGPVTLPGRSIYEGGKISPLLGFLDQLDSLKIYDLCLHTPDESNSNRKTLEEAIKFMHDRYHTVTWIDHGFYGGKINREAIVCDGLDSLTPYYAADYWKQYGTKYFWSPAVEMIKNKNWISVSDNFKKLKFFSGYVAFLQRYASPHDLKNLNLWQLIKKIKTNYVYRYEENTLEYDNGNAMPTPLYWQSPTRTNGFYSWATDQAKEYGNMGEKEVENEYRQLQNLIQHQGIFINHGYFVRNFLPDKDLILRNGKLVTNPNFDKILAKVSQLRSKGDLYVTTIRDLLDYWILLKKVSFEYMPDGSITVINNNDEKISGLSMIARSNQVIVNGEKPMMKKSGDETIFWFNMQPHQEAKVVLK